MNNLLLFSFLTLNYSVWFGCIQLGKDLIVLKVPLGNKEGSALNLLPAAYKQVNGATRMP